MKKWSWEKFFCGVGIGSAIVFVANVLARIFGVY